MLGLFCQKQYLVSRTSCQNKNMLLLQALHWKSTSVFSSQKYLAGFLCLSLDSLCIRVTFPITVTVVLFSRPCLGYKTKCPVFHQSNPAQPVLINSTISAWGDRTLRGINLVNKIRMNLAFSVSARFSHSLRPSVQRDFISGACICIVILTTDLCLL